MTRWSFWLFVLAEFCRRCETKGTWRVCSGVPSGVRGQSIWGVSREAPWSFLALGWNWFHWLSESVTRCATMTSVFAGTTLPGEGGVPPIFSHRFCANLVSGPGGQWGVQTPPKPPPPRGLATDSYIDLHTVSVWICTWNCTSVVVYTVGMFLQIPGLCKTFVTLQTFVWFLSRVDSHVTV